MKDNKNPEDTKETITFIMIVSIFLVTALVTALEALIFLKYTEYMVQTPVYLGVFAVFIISYNFIMYSSIEDGFWSKKRAIIQCILITILCFLFYPVPILRCIIEMIMLVCICFLIISFTMLRILEKINNKQ